MATRTATGVNASWDFASSWSGFKLPTYSDDAVLTAGASLAVTGRDAVNSVTIAGGALLAVNGGTLQAAKGLTLAGSLSLSGTLQNTAITATGLTAVLTLGPASQPAQVTGSSGVLVGAGATLSVVSTSSSFSYGLAAIDVAAGGTLDLTQYKGIPSFGVYMDGSGATLKVDGLNGGDIYGFSAGDVIDFTARAAGSSGVTGKPVVNTSLPGDPLVTANGFAYTLHGVARDATFTTTSDGNGGYLFTTSAANTASHSTPAAVANTIPSAYGICGFTNATSGQQGYVTLDGADAGGPSYLQAQYIYAGSDNMSLATSQPNAFIHGGSGNDAIAVTSGRNVLDGGLGSNFLTGGSGTDTFFTDARGPGVVWNTVRNFHAGDAVTLWGFTAGTSSFNWDAQAAGAAGSQGATLRTNIVGGAGRSGDGVDASVTFAGLSVAQASNLQIVTGTEAAGNYLYIYNPGV